MATQPADIVVEIVGSHESTDANILPSNSISSLDSDEEDFVDVEF